MTSPNAIITPFIKYCADELLYFFRQKVDKIKKTASQITSLLRVNIPKEHNKSEIKLAPSG